METRFTIKTGEKIFKQIHIIMLILFLMLSGYLISLNTDRYIFIVIGCSAYLALSLFRHFYLADMKKNIWQLIIPYIEGIILYSINDIRNGGLALIILLVMDIAIDYEYKYGIIYAVIGYTAYVSSYIMNYMDYSLLSRIFIFIVGAFQFTLFVGFAFLAKGYSLKSNKLRKATSELNAKMIDMEQVTVLKERNRIAGEIHNTVGHQLTTALIQIEATKMIIDSDVEEAKRRLDIIKEELRNGLDEIRKSINAINSDNEYENFNKALEELVVKVKIHGKIDVDYTIDDINEIKNIQKKILYHIILESITNGIRHGNCSKVKIQISKRENIITLSSFNNGIVSKDFKYGYGLNHIKENMKELGGDMTIKVNEDGWFGLLVTLPIYYQKGEAYE